MRQRNGRKGNAIIEFTLVAIPLIFIQISIVEMCRGMWDYHSLAQAVKVASREAATRGAGCAGAGCAMTVGQIATTISGFAVGMPASSLNVTLTSNAGNVTCNPLSTCAGNNTVWPPAGGNAVGSDIIITGSYNFTSMLMMFVPGTNGMQFSGVTFTAKSRQVLLFRYAEIDSRAMRTSGLDDDAVSDRDPGNAGAGRGCGMGLLPATSRPRGGGRGRGCGGDLRSQRPSLCQPRGGVVRRGHQLSGHRARLAI
jgi:Flp pilus assembly protein TadG